MLFTTSLSVFAFLSLMFVSFWTFRIYSIAEIVRNYSVKFYRSIWKSYTIGLLLGMVTGIVAGKLGGSFISLFGEAFNEAFNQASPISPEIDNLFISSLLFLFMFYSPSAFIFVVMLSRKIKVISDSYLLAKLKEKEIPESVLEELKDDLTTIFWFSFGGGYALGLSLAIAPKIVIGLAIAESVFALIVLAGVYFEYLESKRKVVKDKAGKTLVEKVEKPWR